MIEDSPQNTYETTGGAETILSPTAAASPRRAGAGTSWLRLLAKEWRALVASRAYWILLLLVGPLVGNGFITAVNLYAEASGIGGGAAALAEGLTPLDGLLVPTFGAYDLAVMLNSWCFEQDGAYNVTKGRALIAAYQGKRPLSLAEQNALPILMRGASLRFSIGVRK